MKVLVSFVLIFLLFELQSDVCAESESSDESVYSDSIDQYSSKRNNFSLGKRAKGDKLLYEVRVRVEPRSKFALIFDRKVDAVVDVTSKSLKDNKITAIKIEQQKESKFKASGAEFKVLEGGVGMNNVALELTSKRGYGFKYKVLVFGAE